MRKKFRCSHSSGSYLLKARGTTATTRKGVEAATGSSLILPLVLSALAMGCRLGAISGCKFCTACLRANPIGKCLAALAPPRVLPKFPTLANLALSRRFPWQRPVG